MKKTAFLFSGQGAQYPGMMVDLYENIPSCREVFYIADQTLKRSVSKICFQGSQEELNLTQNTQPCMLAADLAAYSAITERGVKADVMAGFSLGEYAALAAAGVIRMEDVFPLIQLRADHMQAAVPVGKGAMAAISGVDKQGIDEMCHMVEGYVEAANYNCPGQIVVSGESEAVEMLLAYAKEQRIKAMRLPVSAPFHCKLMEPASKKLSGPLQKIEFKEPEVPIYMNVDGKALWHKQGMKEKLLEQAKSPVCWEQTLRNMYADGVEIFIELGPGKTLSGFVKKTFKEVDGIHILRVSDMASLEHTVSYLKEIDNGGDFSD